MGAFPFGITDVAAVLNLNIKRRQSNSIYTDCPLCGDKRGKMNLNLQKNVFRCNYCGESGGMLALYSKAHGIGNSDAYREICGIIQAGNLTFDCERKLPDTPPPALNSVLAGIGDIHHTLSMLFDTLTLSERHRKTLRDRGLTEEQIERHGYKSTPPFNLCRTVAERLISQGCTVKGVPGFYMDGSGRWTAAFYSKTAGMLIPVRGIDGLIRGAQIRLDVPIRDKGGDADKDGTKYLWLSSSNKHMGVTSGSPVHFAGDPYARTVYVTEGCLKADIAHCLMNRSFAAVAGANNLGKLDPVLSMLAHNGTKVIVEAHDMDKYRNEMICMGASKIHAMAQKYGMESRQLMWNPNYKGVDDWQLALKRKGMCKKDESLSFKDNHISRRFRVYQLELAGGKILPFAFSGIKALRKAGYEQPPAHEYRLMFDSEILCGAELTPDGVLQKIFSRYNDDLPDNYLGRSISPSDVIELYDGRSSRYYYCDTADFAEVEFSSMSALPMKG